MLHSSRIHAKVPARHVGLTWRCFRSTTQAAKSTLDIPLPMLRGEGGDSRIVLCSVSVGLSKVGEEVAYVICLRPMTQKTGHAGMQRKCPDLSFDTPTHRDTNAHKHSMTQVKAARLEPSLAFSLRSKCTLLLPGNEFELGHATLNHSAEVLRDEISPQDPRCRTKAGSGKN